MTTTTDNCVAVFFVQGLAAVQPRGRAFNVPGLGIRVAAAAKGHPVHTWKDSLRADAKEAMAGRLPEGGPVRLELVFKMPRPQALTKPKHAGRFILVENGKDIDNLCKSVMDALRRLIFNDDKQVSTLIARKQYTMPDEAPGVRIGVFRDEPEKLPFFP